MSRSIFVRDTLTSFARLHIGGIGVEVIYNTYNTPKIDPHIEETFNLMDNTMTFHSIPKFNDFAYYARNVRQIKQLPYTKVSTISNRPGILSTRDIRPLSF